MDTLHDMVYFNTIEKDSVGVTSGILFTEFLDAIISKPRNILILTEDYTGIKHDTHTQCAYLAYKDAIELYNKDYVKVYSDFVWTEFDKQDSLKTLTREEIAELYYLRKKWEPINKYYFEKIKNKYFYLSHDDAHSCKVWYKDINDFYSMLGRAVCNKISLMYDLVLKPFGEELVQKINALNDWGVYLSLRKISIDKDNSVLIPVYCMEKAPSIDSMYDKVDREIVNPSYYLKYYNKWEIIQI